MKWGDTNEKRVFEPPRHHVVHLNSLGSCSIVGNSWSYRDDIKHSPSSPFLHMPLLSRFHVLRQGESPESPLPQPLHRLPIPPRFDVGHSPAPDSNERSPSQCYAQMAQDLRPSLQSACPWFSPEDVELIGNHPIAAGGFSDIWEGMYAGRKVVLKSYRCYMSFNVTQVIAVHHNHGLLQAQY